jgi:hypothetical protein
MPREPLQLDQQIERLSILDEDLVPEIDDEVLCAPEHHSESKEVYLAHTPGLKMVIPAGPRNARTLLASAIRDPDPVAFFEPKRIYRAFLDEVPEDEEPLPLGRLQTVRDVDRKRIAEMAIELTELSRRSRDGHVGRDDLTGGTFTLTNVGSIGGALFTPIIHHPEVAILGMARAAWQPVVEGGDAHGRVVNRLRLPLCLAFDHRVVDGAEAARFINHMAASLRDPKALLLAV